MIVETLTVTTTPQNLHDLLVEKRGFSPTVKYIGAVTLRLITRNRTVFLSENGTAEPIEILDRRNDETQTSFGGDNLYQPYLHCDNSTAEVTIVISQ